MFLFLKIETHNICYHHCVISMLWIEGAKVVLAPNFGSRKLVVHIGHRLRLMEKKKKSVSASALKYPYCFFFLQHTWFKWMGCYQACVELYDELIIWIRCVQSGKHLTHAGQWVPRTRIEKHCTETKLLLLFIIIILIIIPMPSFPGRSGTKSSSGESTW